MDTASPASPDGGDGAGARARSSLELIGLVVAPTTLVTALTYYFGWALTNARSSYFGIDASTLGYSTQDYVLRSVDALYVPLGVLLVLALGAVLVHGAATRRLADPRLRSVARAAVLAGGLLFAVGVVAIFEPLSFSPPYLLATASPAIGIASLAYGLHLLARIDGGRSARAPLSTVLVTLVIVLSAFATVSKYADATGRERAAGLDLAERPGVAVFTPKALDIKLPGVTETRLRGDRGAYGYRYSGLRLLVRSGGRYFLLPDGWTHARGTAIVLADDPAYRFEFQAGGGGGGKPLAGARAANASRPVAPVLGVAPTVFDDTAVGARARAPFPVTSDGEAHVLRGFSVRGADPEDFGVSVGTCAIGGTLKAGAQCELRLAFTPSVKGERSAELVVDLTPGGPEAFTLLGDGR